MLSEIEVWRFCLNWAKRKCDINPRKHPQIWSEQERSLVKLSLNEVVPFIKLHQIDSKTYREEVEPTGISCGGEGSVPGPPLPGSGSGRFRPVESGPGSGRVRAEAGLGVSEASLSRLNIRAEMGGVR